MGACRSLTISTGLEGQRLDSALAQTYGSRSAAAKAIDAGKVLVNGSAAPKKLVVCEGDYVFYELPDAVSFSLDGEDIPLDIRFEDGDLIVLSKQIGLVCHPCDEYPSGTLVNALVHHCGAGNLCNLQGMDDRLGIVHRLDMDTSGLMLAAKTDDCGALLMEGIRERAIDRHYLALVHGIIPHDTGMIDAPIGRSHGDRTKMAVVDSPSSRDALTSFTVLQRFSAEDLDNGYTLVDCKLYTGRTHQIRVHMQYARHPLAGDPLYTSCAPRDQRAQLGLERQFLHSYRLSFEHPMTGEALSFADQLPEDLSSALERIAHRSVEVTEFGREIFDLLERSPKPALTGTLRR